MHEGNGPGPAVKLSEAAEAERRSLSARAASSERFSLRRLRAADPSLSRRLEALSRFGGRVRSSEYHLTNACNLRCQGCWFFAHEFDHATREERSLDQWRAFARREADERRVTAALLIGGEPTLMPERVAAFCEHMPFVTVSTNGLESLPREGFERVTVAVTLFGGGPEDDRLRAIRPNGRRFTGLFDRALENYRGDSRAFFVYALTRQGLPHLEASIERIARNGNQATFNFYSDYDAHEQLAPEIDEQLVEAALHVRERFPETVCCSPYYIETLVSGRTEWGAFGYDVCPSISVDHPGNKERLERGAPVLPGFNAWAADTKTLNLCCTSGHCETCRDSQAVYSWLLVSARRFFRSEVGVRQWVEVAEGYWRQFVWSPWHPSARA